MLHESAALGCVFVDVEPVTECVSFAAGVLDDFTISFFFDDLFCGVSVSLLAHA